MIQINSAIGALIASTNRSLFLVHSFANGSVTASQSGSTITVDFANPHNIPSDAASRVSNAGVYVLLRTASPVFTPQIADDTFSNGVSGWYGNIVVTSANQFTCQAGDSKTVTSQNLVAAGGSLFEVRPQGVQIPAGALSVGSSLELDTAIMLPSSATFPGITSRNIGSRGRAIGASGQTGMFWNDNSITATTRTSTGYRPRAVFLSNTTDSEFVVWSNAGNDVASMRVTPGQNINLNQPFTIVNSLIFNSVAVNDWALSLPMFGSITG